MGPGNEGVLIVSNTEYIKRIDAESALWGLRKGFRRVDEKCAVDACVLEIRGVPAQNVAELSPRSIELAEADAEGRVVILPTKAQEQRALVERALNITLLDWQVAYIWGNSQYLMPGRCTGKTLAFVIRLCLSEGEPLYMYRQGKDWNLCDTYQGPQYFDTFRSYVRDAYRVLKHYEGLKLRTIYFSPAEAREVK